MDKINILGINISKFNKTEVLAQIEAFLLSEKQHYVITPNPEMILTAEKDEEYFYILNNADMSVMDGFGLKIAAWLSGMNSERIAGADLVKDILNIATQKKFKILVITWIEGLSTADEIKNTLSSKYVGLESLIVACDKRGDEVDYDLINDFKPQIVFVALGVPLQEKYIFKNLNKIPSAKFAIGIGGSFDFITGKATRAPKLIRMIGIEWLWRIFQQKKIPGKKIFFFNRIKRVYRSVVVFSWKFFVWRFILPFFYRKNVACMLYKKENDRYKVLIVERVWQKDHWQLPQGGTDCEDIMTAGARELREELNCDKFKPIAGYKNLWKYKFQKNSGGGKYLVDNCWGHKGQAQGLFIAKFLGEDKDIGLNYWDHTDWKWVAVEELLTEIYPTRKESTKVFLNKLLELKNEVKN